MLKNKGDLEGKEAWLKGGLGWFRGKPRKALIVGMITHVKIIAGEEERLHVRKAGPLQTTPVWFLYEDEDAPPLSKVFAFGLCQPFPTYRNIILLLP